MIIETKDGKKLEISKPASKDDMPKIVSAIFTVNDRNKDYKNNKGKAGVTKIINSLERKSPLSTELNEGVGIKAIPGGFEITESGKEIGE